MHLSVGNEQSMVNYINNSVADGLWVVGVAHNNARYVDGALEYFMSELNVNLERVWKHYDSSLTVLIFNMP